MAPADDLKTAVIIEDDPDVSHILAEVLESTGFSTVSAGNGLDGVDAVLTHRPLLTTVDVNVSGLDGFETARRIHAQSDTFIIMLTGLTEEADVVAGLGAGADDYLLKPFRPRELRARVEAMLRRTPTIGATSIAGLGHLGPFFPNVLSGRVETRGEPVAVPTRQGGWRAHRDLRLHPADRILLRDGVEIDLTRTEFDLTATLLESRRRVRSKAGLTLVLRGTAHATEYLVGDADRRAVEAHMTNLRRKLDDDPDDPRYIETVRGVGYRLTSDHAA